MRRARFYVEVKVSRSAPWVRFGDYRYLQPAHAEAVRLATLKTADTGIRVFAAGVRIRYRGITLAKWKDGWW